MRMHFRLTLGLAFCLLGVSEIAVAQKSCEKLIGETKIPGAISSASATVMSPSNTSETLFILSSGTE